MMPLAWESISVANNKIESSAFVLFLMYKCEKFKPEIDPKTVKKAKWKKISDASDEKIYKVNGQEGYAEGDIKYRFFHLMEEEPSN